MAQTLTWRSSLFAALWLVGVAVLLWAGAQGDGYSTAVRGAQTSYPWAGVLTMGAILSGEVALFYALLRPESYRRSWGRALGTALAGVVLTVAFGLGLMHSPPHVYAHWLWVAGATVAFLALAVASAVRARMSLPLA